MPEQARCCGHCGEPFGVDEIDEAAPPRRGRRALITAAGVSVLVAVIAGSVALTRSPRAPEVAVLSPSAQPSTEDGAKGDVFDWRMPDGPRTEVVLAGYVAALGAVDLGAPFDAQLQRLHGESSLFEKHEPIVQPRNEVSATFHRIRDERELALGFPELASLGAKRSTLFASYRALNIRDVVKLDETRGMRAPPERAAYYLAELHVGSAYDVLIRGAARSMGAKLDKLLLHGADLAASGDRSNYQLTFKALGMRPRRGTALLVTSVDDINASYTTEGAGSPVRYVFRQITGRQVNAATIMWPRALFDETIRLEESLGEDSTWKTYELAPGKYTVAIKTTLGVKVSWTGGSCKGGTYRELITLCSLRQRTILKITNPTLIGSGHAEVVDVYVARGHDPTVVEAAVVGR